MIRSARRGHRSLAHDHVTALGRGDPARVGWSARSAISSLGRPNAVKALAFPWLALTACSTFPPSPFERDRQFESTSLHQGVTIKTLICSLRVAAARLGGIEAPDAHGSRNPARFQQRIPFGRGTRRLRGLCHRAGQGPLHQQAGDVTDVGDLLQCLESFRVTRTSALNCATASSAMSGCGKAVVFASSAWIICCADPGSVSAHPDGFSG